MTLRVRGLRKRYGVRAALDGVDLELADGTLTLVTGPNGAGKSTLLRCLAGIARHEGSVERNGSTGAPVAYLPQGNGLPPRARVGDVLRLFGAQTIESEWLPIAMGRPVGELSGGERRRLALAALLSMSAPLILLDEPLADLDAVAATALLRRLAALRDGGTTIVVTAPDADIDRLAPIADRVVRLSRGAIAPEAR